MDSFDFLPYESRDHVCIFLNIRNIVNLRLVNKFFNERISSITFWNYYIGILHQKQYRKLYKKISKLRDTWLLKLLFENTFKDKYINDRIIGYSYIKARRYDNINIADFLRDNLASLSNFTRPLRDGPKYKYCKQLIKRGYSFTGFEILRERIRIEALERLNTTREGFLITYKNHPNIFNELINVEVCNVWISYLIYCRSYDDLKIYLGELNIFNKEAIINIINGVVTRNSRKGFPLFEEIMNNTRLNVKELCGLKENDVFSSVDESINENDIYYCKDLRFLEYFIKRQIIPPLDYNGIKSIIQEDYTIRSRYYIYHIVSYMYYWKPSTHGLFGLNKVEDEVTDEVDITEKYKLLWSFLTRHMDIVEDDLYINYIYHLCEKYYNNQAMSNIIKELESRELVYMAIKLKEMKTKYDKS